MERLVYAAAKGAPIVDLLALDSGEVIGIPSHLDGAGAFDYALPRDGWVAVKVGYEVGAFGDGDPLKPVKLPAAWEVRPAAEASLALLKLYPGRSQYEDEDVVVAVVGADGGIQRSVALPMWGLIGAVESGIICANGSWTWDGELLPGLSEHGRPIGVLGGSVIVFQHEDEVEALDVVSGLSQRCSLPAGVSLRRNVSYDATGSRLALTADGGLGVLIAEVDKSPQWIPAEFGPFNPVWLGDDTLLLGASTGTDPLVQFNFKNESITRLPLGARTPTPRADATGRFDLGDVRATVRAATSVNRAGGQLDSDVVRVREALKRDTAPAVSPYLDLARPAVRLRVSLWDPDRSLGASRLGGRPDVPNGYKWPAYDDSPMAFLAQFRLHELSEATLGGALPSWGLLLVFVGLEAESGWPLDESAVHVELVSTVELHRAGWPRRLPRELRFGVANVVPEPLLTLPSMPPGIREALKPIWKALVAKTLARPPRHQMLGYPVTEQAYFSDKDGQDRVLLLQLDSDGTTGFFFGDGGKLHFWVPAPSLITGEFHSAVVTIDSP